MVTSYIQVAGLVWYSEVFINTAATALVSVGVGNGTARATRTSVVQNEGAFTFNAENTANAGALTQLNFQPTAVISGATLYVMLLITYEFFRANRN